ncbi:hypothetical protein Dda_0903 [Drechslerella dactyloides]|uniref:Complex 1 LYR protein domain-containing protein n=1 Tax=Drechslerella dactyloides TaxID=74499 RepID=A0AAD6J6F9_DREDA|nr:hypothetical protein Dda_0903 [Drechslerella dactyloides]
MIHPTAFALPTKQSANWAEANRRVLQAYRNWQRQAPEIVKLYMLEVDVPAVRAKIREEFERHRHVKDLGTVDVLLMKNHMEFQVPSPRAFSYVPEQEPHTHVPKTFMENFLEGRN